MLEFVGSESVMPAGSLLPGGWGCFIWIGSSLCAVRLSLNGQLYSIIMGSDSPSLPVIYGKWDVKELNVSASVQ